MRFWKNMKESLRHKWGWDWRIGNQCFSLDLSVNLRTFGFGLCGGWYHKRNINLIANLGLFSLILVTEEES